MAATDREVRRWLEALSGEVEPWEEEDAHNAASVEDAFSRSLSFGTGGIRGLMGAGPNRMNRLTVGCAAQGLADWLTASVGNPRVVVGYDTRIHSLDFAQATAQVLAANGVRVLLFDVPVPTPVVDFAIRRLRCDAGVVITASHNPKEYNGFKVYISSGDQATDDMTQAIQARMELIDPFSGIMWEGGCGEVESVSPSLLDEYLSTVHMQSPQAGCQGLKVVYSPLNGTGLVPAERMLRMLGVDYALVEEQASPDGSFPTCPRPNPELLQAMEPGMAKMASSGADLFLANDPDADRLGVACMDHGKPRLLTGDEVGLILFDWLSGQAGESAGRLVAVTTIVSTPLADQIAEAKGIELRRTLTGFKYAGQQIDLLEAQGEADRFLFAFEESCGYLRGAYVRDKDGICALMLVCQVAAAHKAAGRSLPEALEDIYARYGRVVGRQLTLEAPALRGRATIGRVMRDLRAAPFRSVAGLDVESVTDYSRGVSMPVVGGPEGRMLPSADVLQFDLENGSRVIIRPSGTESKLKCYCFAAGSEADRTLERICADLESFLTSYRVGGPGLPVHIVLLSGGSGTRLWPLSNSLRSKQFLKVLSDGRGGRVSMVQRVFSQIERVEANLDVTIATSSSQAEELALQVPSERYSLVAEPERRDTAPAIMLACENLALEQGADLDDTVIVMPIDTYADQAYYDSIAGLDAAVRDGVADLVLLGVRPTYPSEKYGYIVPAATVGAGPWPVARFTEKPDEATAQTLIEKGALWNCGVFAFRLGWLLELTKDYLDEPTFEAYRKHYATLPKNSFDYEVVEKANSIAVVPYTGAWKDLGTWSTLTEEMVDAVSGRAVLDEDTCENVHVINETELPMVVAGLHDAVVVATQDGILACGKRESAAIKNLVSRVAEDRPMYERKRWGEYRVLDHGTYADGGQSLTREIVVGEGEQVPYRRHTHCDEVWTVVSGEGEVVLDGVVRGISAGDVVEVPHGMAHACRGMGELRIIEVQLGDSLVGGDVESFGNFWE